MGPRPASSPAPPATAKYMPNLLLISVAECDTRVALVEDGRLSEFHVEAHLHDRLVGNIYKGRVVKLLPGMAAAFVELGLERPAYLFAEDVTAQEDEFYQLWLKEEENAAPEPPRRQPPAAIGDLLHEGQEIMAQVLRGPLGQKGARLTTQIALAGHYLVYIPTLAQPGVSRRIQEEAERRRLKELLEELQPPEGAFIARTACRGEASEKLGREREVLLARWQQILRRKDAVAAPALLHQEMEAARRLLREVFSPAIDRVVLDEPEVYGRTMEYLESFSPGDKYRVELYEGEEPLFAHFGLELDWKKLLAPRVWLKSGGYLLIDATEALTAIDVNTGKFVGRRDLEETILQTDLEAAREIARQIRLRNLGGLIVIDFIDLEKPAHREEVYQALVQGLSRDRAKSTVLPMSSLGLIEMTRQRLGRSLAQVVLEPCTCCGGRGEVLAKETLACDIMRQLEQEAREFPGCRLTLAAHPQVIETVKAEGRELLSRLAVRHRLQVSFLEEALFSRDHFEITREWPKQ
jgi:ribonuclease G